MKKRILAMILVIAVITSMIPTAYAESYDIYNSDNIKEINLTTGIMTHTNNTTTTLNLNTVTNLNIFATNSITIKGQTNKIRLCCLGNCKLTLDNVTIDMTGKQYSSPLGFYDSGNVLTLVGNSTLIGSDMTSLTYSNAGIQVSSGNEVTIESTTGGSLTVVGGYFCPGIGGRREKSTGTIIINGGNITATGGHYAAGIGGSDKGGAGNIIINGGNITANGGYYAAGIGNGNIGDGGNVTINGGIVTASTTSTYGVGIGSGNSGSRVNVNIKGGEVYAKGGNSYGYDIGVLYPSSSACALNISDDAVVFFGNNKYVAPTTTHTKVYHETISNNSAYGYSNIPSSWSGVAYAYLPLTTYVINDATIAAYGSTTNLDSLSTAIDTIQIDTTQTVTITDSKQIDREIEIEGIRNNVDVIIKNVKLDVSGVTDGKALTFTGANNELTLVGESNLKSYNGQPVIDVQGGNSLSINSNSDGKLHAMGSLGNTTSQISILGGVIYAQSYEGSVTIGGTSAVFGIDTDAFNNPTTTSHTYVDSDTINNNSAYGYNSFPDSWSGIAYGYIKSPIPVRFYDEDGSTLLDTLNITEGQKINELNVPKKTGYSGSWYEDSNFNENSLWDFETDTVTAALDLYVKWTMNTYTIDYILNGGTNNAQNPSQYNIFDSNITLLDASNAGYTFEGWYDNAAFSGSAITTLDTSDAENKEFHAKFSANSATVSFDGNGNTSGSSPSDILSQTDAVITLPGNTGGLKNIGFIYNGWSESSSGTAISGDYTVPAGGVTLYAVWLEDSSVPRYAVTFDTQGGSNVDSQTIPEQAYASKPNNPTRNDYTFGGWYTNSACGDDDRWNFNACSVIGDTTLFAKWIANSTVTTHTVKFNSQSGSLVNDQTVIDGDYVSKPDNPTRSGYTFGGWYINSACSDDDRWNFNACSVIGDTTLFAKWIANSTVTTHTVKFNSQSGSLVNDQTVIDGDYVSKPDNPTRSGYTFGGWYTNSACSDDDRWNFNDCSVIGDTTLFAKWNVISVTDLEFNNTYKALRLATTDSIDNICPYTVYPTSAIDKSVHISSSNPSVATVSGGVITAHSEGRALISITANDTTNGTYTSKMMVEVMNSSATGLSTNNTNITGHVINSNGVSLSNILVTTYSDPMDTLTDSGSGFFSYSSIPYTHHTMVLSDDNGYEIGRFILDFSNDGFENINVDNANNTVNISYADFTSLVDFTIQINDTFTDISIIDSNISGNQIIPNPKTYDNSLSVLQWYIVVLFPISIFIMFAYIKRRSIYEKR